MKKIRNIILLIMMSLMPVISVLAEGEPAYRGKEKNIIYIVGIVLLIIRVVVPIILIVMASVDLVKAMTQNDDRETKKVIMGILPKVISAIIIFILPSLLVLVLKIINQDSLWTEYGDCLTHPFGCGVTLWEEEPTE